MLLLHRCVGVFSYSAINKIGTLNSKRSLSEHNLFSRPRSNSNAPALLVLPPDGTLSFPVLSASSVSGSPLPSQLLQYPA